MFASSFRSRLAAGTAGKLSPPFPRIVLLKLSLLSISTADNDSPTSDTKAENTCPMSDFLLNECGLCQADLSTILRKRPAFVRKRSTRTAQQAVQFLRDSGFTEDQVRKIINRNPSMLDFIAEGLKLKIELLKTLGFTAQDFGNAIYNGLTEDQVRMMITRSPRVLNLNIDRQLKPKLEFMKTWGLTAQIIGNVISHEPNLLCCNLQKTLRPNVQYLENIFGSETFSKVLKWAPQILGSSNGPDYLEKKMKHLASFGFLEDEVRDLFRRNPRVLAVSIKKVQKLMDFVIHTAGLPAKFLLTNPELLDYSLERRIKPRYKVLNSISAMQPSKRLPSLNSVLCLTEGKFFETYVKCSPHATKLLEIYSGKRVDLDVIQ